MGLNSQTKFPGFIPGTEIV